jgi:hypothetical protein
MIPVKQIDPEDLPLYAMQLLSPEEMEEMTQNLQYSREARRQLTEVVEELSFYAHSVELEAPTADARQRLLKAITREKKVVSIDTAALPTTPVQPLIETVYVDAPRRPLAARLLPWAGWAIAAGMAFAAGRVYMQNTQLDRAVSAQHDALLRMRTSEGSAAEVADLFRDPHAQNVVLTASKETPPPEGRLAYNSSKGTLVFLATNMVAPAGGKTYELWVIPTGGEAAIPAGTFTPDAQGYASVILPPLPKGVTAAQFGVTMEQEGGSSTPTLPILMGGKPA